MLQNVVDHWEKKLRELVKKIGERQPTLGERCDLHYLRERIEQEKSSQLTFATVPQEP